MKDSIYLFVKCICQQLVKYQIENVNNLSTTIYEYMERINYLCRNNLLIYEKENIHND